jgi:hypothetical protein
MKISTIVVGLGKIGMMYDFKKKNHYNNHCQALETHKNFDLIAAVDSDKNKKKNFLKKYNLPFFTNLSKAFKETKPNLIIISTPTSQNDKLFDYIKRYNINPKIFLIEKPGSYNYDNFKKFIVFCKKKKIRIIINYQRSFCDSLKIFNKFLSLDKNIKIYVNYKKSFYNSCSHYINFFFKIIKTKNYKIIDVSSYKQFNKDFVADCKIKIKYLIEFKFKKNSQEKIIFQNSKKHSLTYYTEKSKIILKKQSISNIKNNFNLNLKNLLDTIYRQYKKKNNFNLNSSLTTLKIITNIKKR